MICVLGALLCATALVAQEASSSRVDARLQQRVTELVQDAFASRSPTRNNQTNSAWENSLRVEANFREASRLLPERLDLRFGIASALIGQATLTNCPAPDLKMKEALAVYEEISAMDTNGFEGPLLFSAYTRAIGDVEASNAAVKRLLTISSDRTKEYIERFSRLDAFLDVTPNEDHLPSAPLDQTHAIVVLGAGLETNGTVKPKLAARLEQALKLARAYPKSPIVLTGGNQKNGVTEAYAMKLWLRKRGIPQKRLFLEDVARDTVGNALYTSTILKKLAVTDITVVTSSNHIRRGLADLDEACRQLGLNLHYANLAASGEPELDKKAERIGTYRDVLRITGLWAYPGILR